MGFGDASFLQQTCSTLGCGTGVHAYGFNRLENHFRGGPIAIGRKVMKKLTVAVLTVGAIISLAGPAGAQGIYFDLGPGAGPRPYYRDYDEPRYYRGERLERGYYRPGRFRTWNGCQSGWTVQDGLCKPYRGR
jgi:hypothetical protein